MTVWSRIAASLVKLPPPRTTAVSVERGLTAKMPDGVELVADRWYPTHPSADPPTVLIRTPYGRTVMGPLGRLYAERGYQVVVQSCRGTFGSGGDFVPVRNEEADGRSTLEWVAAQPWFDGRLVMWGGSYLGMTQWAVAQDPPDFLRALSFQVTGANFRDSVVFPGGAFALETGLAWLHEIKNQELGWRTVLRTHLRGAKVVAASSQVLPLGKCDTAAIGEPMAFYQEWLEHSTPGDTWWDGVDFGRRLDNVPPASFIGGWFDLFLRAQVADYEALRRAGRTARLTIGPWTHASPALFAETVRDGPRWFDSQLGNGRAGGDERQDAPVRVFVMGSRTWREFSIWPPAGKTERWYLGQGGTLTQAPPSTSGTDVDDVDDPPDRYHYNPSDPTPSVGGPSLNMATAGRKEQRRREQRRDVLTYTSPVLTDDLTVIGPLTATLHVRSSLEHTDFFVRLCDVTEKGKSFNLSDGIVRLTPGAGAVAGAGEQDEDGVRTLDITMWPTANTFRAGHRIRLQVSSGAHPLFNRNAGTGEPLATGTNLRSADQEVFHDAGRPSSIALHVVPLFDGGSMGEHGMGSSDPLANLPRMTQPTFVPIAEADQVRPARHLHVPGAWTTDRPAELRGPTMRQGANIGTPGPDSGFALRLAHRFGEQLKLGEGESAHDVELGVALVASKRAALFGRAPCVYDVKLALNLWGFLHDVPADVQETRRELFSSISHDYVAQRALVDSVPEETLRQSPDEVRVAGGPTA